MEFNHFGRFQSYTLRVGIVRRTGPASPENMQGI